MTDTDAAPVEGGGQAAGGSSESTPADAPETGRGQAEGASPGRGTSRTTAVPQDSAAETSPTFFDPKTVPKELEPAYKNMQAAFTKAMQKASEGRQKAEFYDRFSQDPVGHMQKLASQYGFQLTRQQAAAAVADQQGQAQSNGQPWQPNSWEEVEQRIAHRAKAEARQELMRDLQPLVQEVQQTKKQSIERQLSEIDPTWQQYESEMVALLQQHPTLSKDPSMLYRMSVPQEVIESRATQRALQRFESKAKSSTAAGGSTTSRKPGSPDPEKRYASVAEAWADAQRKLEEEGIRPPR